MRAIRYSTWDDLSPFAEDWDRLAAGNPFRGWAWASTWWRHYGNHRKSAPCGEAFLRATNELYVLAVFDAKGRLAGIAPWTVDCSPLQGRVLRFLGAGEVCSEYLGVMAEPGMEEAVAHAAAQWLLDTPAGIDRWDLLELTAVDPADRCTVALANSLGDAGTLVHQRSGPSCWRIDLPGSWPEFLGAMPRHRRRLLTQAENRLLRSGKVVVHHVSRAEELSEAQDILIDLHQRRLQTQGQPGSFASPRFMAFHRDVMFPLLARGQLELTWVELDGHPLAAEYVILGADISYSYQCGLNPDYERLSPGRFANMTTIRRAIAQGHRAIDFLRGDEPYKAQWLATPRPTLEIRIAANRFSARSRLRLWIAGSSAKRAWKQRCERTRGGTTCDSSTLSDTAKLSAHDDSALLDKPAVAPARDRPAVASGPQHRAGG